MVQLTPRARLINQQICGPLVEESARKLQAYSTKELTLLRDFTRWCLELQLRHIERLRTSGD
jgi:hypothetical protein